VVAAAGHTPGNVVVLHEGEGWLFSGDQLLPGITPTPALQLDPATMKRFRSLPAFLRSLQAVLALGPERCFPGHGEPFTGATGALQASIDAIESRTQRVLEAIDAGDPTTYQVCERLYPRAAAKRFWQIFPTVVGHLDVLEERGLVAIREGRWARL
jgi:glyoxylase-like metal-dependent hydrolase (beta-lactamase superfamily II)